MFPGPNSPDGVWNNLAPVSRMTKLKELQLVGYSPVNFSNGSATGKSPLRVFWLYCLMLWQETAVSCVLFSSFSLA